VTTNATTATAPVANFPYVNPSLERVLHIHATLDRKAALARDPVRFVRRYANSREDQEIAALVCALLAFGNVTVISQKLQELLVDRLGDRPALCAREWPLAALEHALDSFVHRTFVGRDLARLLFAAGAMQREHNGLFTTLEQVAARERSLKPALIEWTQQLRHRAFGPSLTPSQSHLVPDPKGASACKRLALLCRWIARPDDGVDLGIARISPRILIVPLDVHVHRIARALALTDRTTASWYAAVDVTRQLAKLDPEDPVKFDFALCHTEIARRFSPKD
jgi:uncharacterized protein (TIGR02757 family)